MKTLILLFSFILVTTATAQKEKLGGGSINTPKPKEVAPKPVEKNNLDNASYESLARCLQEVEQKIPGENINLISMTQSGVKISLMDSGFNLSRTVPELMSSDRNENKKVPFVSDKSTEIPRLRQEAYKKIEAGLDKFKNNVRNKLIKTGAIALYQAQFDKIKAGLCHCEKAGFDKQKIGRARESMTEAPRFRVKALPNDKESREITPDDFSPCS